MNVMLWIADAKKAWCKFDLEPAAFMRGTMLAASTHRDDRWYPDGLPLVFIGAHNTKNSKETDLLLTLWIRCTAAGAQIDCPKDGAEKEAVLRQCSYGNLKQDEDRLLL